MKFSELSGTSPAGRPPGLGPEPNGKGLVVNNIPTPSPNWTLLRLRPLPIVRNSKNVRCSTTCYFNHCILHYTLLHYIRFESNILVKRSTDTTNSEAYPEPSQTSKIELLVKIVNGWKPLTIFAERSILNVWQYPEYVIYLFYIMVIYLSFDTIFVDIFQGSLGRLFYLLAHENCVLKLCIKSCVMYGVV